MERGDSRHRGTVRTCLPRKSKPLSRKSSPALNACCFTLSTGPRMTESALLRVSSTYNHSLLGPRDTHTNQTPAQSSRSDHRGHPIEGILEMSYSGSWKLNVREQLLLQAHANWPFPREDIPNYGPPPPPPPPGGAGLSSKISTYDNH